jgi:hypothetical protein
MVFLCLRTLLGLTPDLATQQLLIDPALPPWLERIDVRDMQVFGARMTFRVRRGAKGDHVAGGQGRLAQTRMAAPA